MLVARIICGSREWSDVARVEEVLEAELSNRGDIEYFVAIIGGAPGVDTIAERYLRRVNRDTTPLRLGFRADMVICPADWNRHKKAAGPIRNNQMLILLRTLAAVGYEPGVIAFPLPGGRGTQDMMKKARDEGFPVREIR